MEVKLDETEDPKKISMISDNEREAYDMGAIAAILHRCEVSMEIGPTSGGHISLAVPLVHLAKR
ncbi:MAG: hypothetical protein ACYTG0_25110 [Planctomycetota bacterium]|jgi:hypothetical protein